MAAELDINLPLRDVVSGGGEWAAVPPAVRRAITALGSSLQVLWARDQQTTARMAEQRQHYEAALTAAKSDAAAVAEAARSAERDLALLRARVAAVEDRAARETAEAAGQIGQLEASMANARADIAAARAQSTVLADTVLLLQESLIGGGGSTEAAANLAASADTPAVSDSAGRDALAGSSGGRPLVYQVRSLGAGLVAVKEAVAELTSAAAGRAVAVGRLQEASRGGLEVLAELAGHQAALSGSVRALEEAHAALASSSARKLDEQSSAVERLGATIAASAADQRLASMERAVHALIDARRSGAEAAALETAQAAGLRAALDVAEPLAQRLSQAEAAIQTCLVTAKQAERSASEVAMAYSGTRERVASLAAQAEAAAAAARAAEGQMAAAAETARRAEQRAVEAAAAAAASADKAGSATHSVEALEAAMRRSESKTDERLEDLAGGLRKVEKGLSSVSAHAIKAAESLSELSDVSGSSRSLLEQLSGSLLVHQERLERLTAELSDRPSRPEMEARLARHPTLDVMREFVHRSLALAGPEHEALAGRIADRTKASVLASLGYGPHGHLDGSSPGRPGPGVSERRAAELERSVEALRTAVDAKASKWELDNFRKDLAARASKEEVGLALARKVDLGSFLAHVRECAH